MEPTHYLFLAILQGLTEFLPISSSAHLIFIPKLLQWQDQGLAFDVAVHLGTLVAVLWYFRHDLYLMIRDFFSTLAGGKQTQNSRLSWAILFATIPVGLAGLVFRDTIAGLRSTEVIATTTIVFGLLLGWADWRGRRNRDEHSLSWQDIVVIGGAQALALLPGTSRSGITITAGLFLGLRREAAARFSFLLAIPVIFLAGGLEAIKLSQSNDAFAWAVLLPAFAVSALTAYFCIHYFIQLFEKIGLLPFVIYRIALGVLLFAFF